MGEYTSWETPQMSGLWNLHRPKFCPQNVRILHLPMKISPQICPDTATYPWGGFRGSWTQAVSCHTSLTTKIIWQEFSEAPAGNMYYLEASCSSSNQRATMGRLGAAGGQGLCNHTQIPGCDMEESALLATVILGSSLEIHTSLYAWT
jgi:hypothetical protein